MIPETLDGWTLDAVGEVAASGLSENDLYDFKVDLQDAEGQRKVAAAFANTRGGYLIFGVTKDHKVVGVENVELPRDFGIKLGRGIEPSVQFRFGPPLDLGAGRRLYIAEVPRSRRGPHAVLLNNAWVFLKRTPAGTNDPMSYEEIRAAFVEGSQRRNDLLLLRSEVQRIHELAKRVNVGTYNGPIHDLTVVRYDTAMLELVVPRVFLELGSDSVLIERLNDLREACGGADRFLETLPPRAPIDHANGQVARDHLRRDALRILNDAHTVLTQMEAIR